MPDTTLPDTGFNRIAIYRIYRIVASLNIRVSLQLKFKQNMYMCFHWNKFDSLQMKARLVKPVKYDLSSRSSVFTPVSPISKTEISGKILPDTGYYRIPEFYRILVSGSGTSLLEY